MALFIYSADGCSEGFHFHLLDLLSCLDGTHSSHKFSSNIAELELDLCLHLNKKCQSVYQGKEMDIKIKIHLQLKQQAATVGYYNFHNASLPLDTPGRGAGLLTTS